MIDVHENQLVLSAIFNWLKGLCDWAVLKFFYFFLLVPGFIASDSRDDGLVTNLLIILEYHENGSLCDYLPSVTLTLPSLLRMLLSIADGLHYLHTAVVGNTGKPSIAHRDIKSKNILVKKDGE